jgi:hypothetical protein
VQRWHLVLMENLTSGNRWYERPPKARVTLRVTEEPERSKP